MKFLLILSIFILSCSISIAQDIKKKVIQFTGVIFTEDSASVVSGSHVYIPKSGRGTTTNPYGFFSLPVLEGDSIVFSSLGYNRAYFIVPKHEKESSLRRIIVLQEDITFLEEVEIRPYPTERMFKDALITMDVSQPKEYANIYQWLNDATVKEAYLNLVASPNENHRYFIQQQQQAYLNRYQQPQNQFLNPFAWANFIKSLRRKK